MSISPVQFSVEIVAVHPLTIPDETQLTSVQRAQFFIDTTRLLGKLLFRIAKKVPTSVPRSSELMRIRQLRNSNGGADRIAKLTVLPDIHRPPLLSVEFDSRKLTPLQS